jgi:hypothetical protein
VIPNPLPQGVTGFNAPGSFITFSDFEHACARAARELNGRVDSAREAYQEPTPNFHETIITLERSPYKIRVVCNAHYPIVAFATPPRQGEMLLEFVDCPELAERMKGEFTTLSATEAGTAVSTEMLSSLDAGEISQVDHWEPKRVGDVIFNWWD